MNKKKLNSIQALRCLAFLGVFIQHTLVPFGGAAGVSIFIILSGFLLTYNYYDRSLSCKLKDAAIFSLSKIKKLYPLHILTLLICLPFYFNVKLSEAIKLLLNTFLIHAFIPDPTIYYSYNGVSWYLSICIVLYFSFPYILKVIKTHDSIKFSVLISLFMFFIQILLAFAGQFTDIDTARWIVYICPITRLLDLTIGANLGYLFINKSESTDYTKKYNLIETLGFLIIAALILIIFVLKIPYNYHDSSFYFTAVYTLPSVFLVWVFAETKGVITKLLSNKIFIYIGNLSSISFLIHLPVINYTGRILNRIGFKNRLITVLIELLLTLILSQIIYKVTKNKILKTEKPR